ncbi:MAG: phosphoesterase, partial [Gammaproteobacteria bacterium]|nr:phosphoesterase [Gammaproteobacteria bacterium]
AATPPGDNPPPGYNENGFNFDLFGVRVPGIVVSPRIPAGKVDHTLYDHTSVLKTLEELFDLQPLTKRDAAANSVLKTLSLQTPRTDCPTTLNVPIPRFMAAVQTMTEERRAQLNALPLPDSGNFVNTMHTLRKAEIEMSGRTPHEVAAVKSKFDAIKTRGDAEAYAHAVLTKVRRVKEKRKLGATRK